METEAELETFSPPQPENVSPTDHNQKFKRLKKSDSAETNFPTSPLKESGGVEDENEFDDGLDPLFGEEKTAKRVLEFDENESGFSEDEDDDFELESGKNKRKKSGSSSVEWLKKKERTKKKKEKTVVSSIVKEKKERKARLAQQADFQRVMRERRGVGFKPAPMVEKSISSVLEKIRQRKLEVSNKVLSSTTTSVKQTRSENVPETSTSVSQVEVTSEHKSGSGDEQTRSENAAEAGSDAAPLDTTRNVEFHLSDEMTSNIQPLADEVTQSFRAPVNDTQDLFTDSERNNSQGDELYDSCGLLDNVAPSAASLSLKLDSALPDSPDDMIFHSERNNSQGDELYDSCGLLENVAPSAVSLSLKLDSALPDSPDDISSDEEESDKENIEPPPKHHFRGKSTESGDPVKAFVDEEALEDDSDNDLLHTQEKDEEDNSDIEEACDYIATDFKEKQLDREKNKLLHQQWEKQEDETRTKILLHKLKYGTDKSEPSLLDDDDDDNDDKDKDDADDDEGEDDDDNGDDHNEDVGKTKDEEDESDEDVSHIPPTRATTKKLKLMIPQMFTDEDDGFVSSEDEETERRLSKKCLLQKVEMQQQSKFSSPAEDETSREVFCRIKKLNVVPETKKKAKQSSIFDALLNKGSSNNSSKSSFLRRASSNSGPTCPSSHKQGRSTGKSFIFGRDDSNSRSSMSVLEDPPSLDQKEKNQAKKNSSAKFTSSQSNWSTQHREVRSEKAHETSLLDILRASSAQTGFDDTRDSLVNQQAVFAAFKSVKKQVKFDGRSYHQGS